MAQDEKDSITWKQIRMRLEKTLADSAETVRSLLVQRKVDEAVKFIENSIRAQVTHYDSVAGTVSSAAMFPVKD